MLEKQFQFSKMLGFLFAWMAEKEYNWSLGDAWRSTDKLACPHCGREHSYQEVLVYNQRSKTLNSKHLDRLAIDINLFTKEGKLAPTEDYLPIVEKWEALGGKAGYRFRFIDPGHFEL
jgi:hypothetical protein